MSYVRIIDLNQLVSEKSCFLFGPRQTGKSWLIREQLRGAKIYNLLEVDTFRALSKQPRLMRDELRENEKLVAIDEVQLLPEILNEVHLLIEQAGVRFLLTGSSARSLKRKGVNLLGGRAQWKNLFPLVRKELQTEFNLERALTHGLLPSIYSAKNPHTELRDYVDIYLREEIKNETAMRNLPTFSRFLDVAALCNTQMINYTNIGNDTQISPSTVREYFRVLEDTLIISRLPAWRESKKRKATATDKYYFFDVGVARYLQGRTNLTQNTDDFGSSFETYLYHELRSYCSYVSREPLSYWATSSGFEVDFLLGDHTAIEVKSTTQVHDRHLKGLKALQEEGAFKRYFLVSCDKRDRHHSGIEIMYFENFLESLWGQN